MRSTDSALRDCMNKGAGALQMGVANRDIKLENTLLMDLSDKPVLKLCDFGYSKDELCASISKTMCGEGCTFRPLCLSSVHFVFQCGL